MKAKPKTHQTLCFSPRVSSKGMDDDPPDESSRRSSLIQTLGQDDGPDTLKLYIRRPSQEEQKTAQGKGWWRWPFDAFAAWLLKLLTKIWLLFFDFSI